MLILLFLLGVMSGNGAQRAEGEEPAAAAAAGGGGRGRGGGGEVFTFAGDVRDFAVVSSGSVYVVTRERLYHLDHTLSELQSRSQRGSLTNNTFQRVPELQSRSQRGSLTNNTFQRVPEALVPEDGGGAGGEEDHPGNNPPYFVVNLMVPFVENGTLVVCGETLRGCDYCELLDLEDIRRSVHMEKISLGSGPDDSFSGGLVRVAVRGGKTRAYILAAKRKYESCGILVGDRGVYLHNTDDLQTGGIFSEKGEHGNAHIWTRLQPVANRTKVPPGGTSSSSSSDDAQKKRPNIKFELVDGFQINSTVYTLSRIPSSSEDGNGGGGDVRLVWLESKKGKSETLKSLRGATLRCCKDGGGGFTKRGFLRSSSVIVPPRGGGGASRVLWAGVFAAAGRGGGGDTRTQDGANNGNTALAVFDISPRTPRGASDDDPHFCSNCDKEWDKDKANPPEVLSPEAVLFRHDSMTSVLALRHKTWTLLFIGTGDGQLIKLAVDQAYRSACPRVLFKTADDRNVFPKIQLDPVSRRHVYVAIEKQMHRVPVSQCETHMDLKACWSAGDPYCGWCDSKNSCTFEEECPGSVWLSIPDDSNEQKIVSHRVEKSNGQINLTIQAHLSRGGDASPPDFSCFFSTTTTTSDERMLCDPGGPAPRFPWCTCLIATDRLPARGQGLNVTVTVVLGKTTQTRLEDRLRLTNCSHITGPPTSLLCRQCIMAGCGWSDNTCSWTNLAVNKDAVCTKAESGMDDTEPHILSVSPSEVSFHGRNNVLMTGRNLGHVTGVRFHRDMDCSPKESAVRNRSGLGLVFDVPAADKGPVKICAVMADGSCHGHANLTYRSSPVCGRITPDTSWASGNRIITMEGSNLEFVEELIHGHEVTRPTHTHTETLWYVSPPLAEQRAGESSTSVVSVSLKVANQILPCPVHMTYHPDPHFHINFTSVRTGPDRADLQVTVQKKRDKLNLTLSEVSVRALQGDKQYECVMERIGPEFLICKILNKTDDKIQALMITFGDRVVVLTQRGSLQMFLLLLLLLLPVSIVAVVVLHRSQQNTLTAQMNKRIEDLELDIRNDIRQGFVDLQTEKSALIENVGTIPFLDYKHFASRIFFPEGGTLVTSYIKDIGQDAVKVQPEACCQALSKLIQDQLFLTSMVHALEEQKTFTIKDKCTVASLLTVALHGDLVYLTQVMEDLLRALMEQPSNAHPKLLLRRTESIVEKLLTNWMSICLYGFLRERVGQHLYLLVSALTQQISKGPVDSVTEKALYTLSEDWLLWQAQDFSTVKLKVQFTVGGGDGEVSDPLEVSALSCDTVEQVKEKILATFKAKFGFPYNTALRDLRIEMERGGAFVALEEVDSSSEVVNDMTMLNTLQHYKVPDGASIKVLPKTSHPPLSPQGSLKDDQNFSVKYFHLIDPDVAEDQKGNPERRKFKLKEVHLTKLLSTKVSVHSFVENLFRGVWGSPLQAGGPERPLVSRAPHAIKYFFDFLDAQADAKKISDPDVLHIWKTNSLLLRFWINILKNPQFVFDMEKSPHLDGCLSVVAQAFMDAFSLTDTPLGKHAPTNKLLYAKDMPQFRQEVKAFYKQVRDQPPISSSEFNRFLREESKKHENEFDESAALRDLYKFLQQYFTEIKQKLEQNGAPADIMEQLQHVKEQFDGLKSCSWN